MQKETCFCVDGFLGLDDMSSKDLKTKMPDIIRQEIEVYGDVFIVFVSGFGNTAKPILCEAWDEGSAAEAVLQDDENINLDQIISIQELTVEDLPKWELFLHGKYFSLTKTEEK